VDPITGDAAAVVAAFDPNWWGLTVVPPPLITVPIDVRPRSDTNPINPFSQGVIPVAILTTEDFDALTVDDESVLFGPDEAEKVHKRAHVADVDADGDLDLLLHFRTQDTGIALGDTEACLIGQTYDGIPLEGCDFINTLPPGHCGLGFELVFLVPPLMWLHHWRKRRVH
jgi:hypothetical protein